MISMASIFAKRILNRIFVKQLFSEGDKIIVGVSGGPDSVALVRVLQEFERKYQFKLHLVHINYGLRAEDSDGDERFVADLAEALDLPLTVIRYHANAKAVKGNLEENLRNFRYEQFEKIRKQKKFDLIAVGHNLNDQAETLLMHLLRGCGSAGMAAMRVCSGRLIRPLLKTTRAEVLLYLESLGQAYREDRTNNETIFFRNRIRKELLVILEGRYQPQIIKLLGILAENIQMDYDLVEFFVNKAYTEGVILSDCGQGKSAVIDLGKYQAYPEGFFWYLLKKIMVDLGAPLKDLSQDNFLELMKIIVSSKSKNQQMRLGKLFFEKKGNLLNILIKY